MWKPCSDKRLNNNPEKFLKISDQFHFSSKCVVTVFLAKKVAIMFIIRLFRETFGQICQQKGGYQILSKNHNKNAKETTMEIERTLEDGELDESGEFDPDLDKEVSEITDFLSEVINEEPDEYYESKLNPKVRVKKLKLSGKPPKISKPLMKRRLTQIERFKSVKHAGYKAYCNLQDRHETPQPNDK